MPSQMCQNNAWVLRNYGDCAAISASAAVRIRLNDGRHSSVGLTAFIDATPN